MAEVRIDGDEDELGPIDYLVVELPAGRRTLTGELAMEVAALVDAGMIRLLDLVVIDKAPTGAFEAFEIGELDHAEEILGLAGTLAEVLAASDVADLAAAVAPGRTAGVLVWENTWAAPLAAAARRAGGQVVADGRISLPALATSLGLDAAEDIAERGW